MNAHSSPYCSDRSENGLVVFAVAAAVVGHLLFLMLPLPEPDRVLVAPQPATDVIRLTDVILDPPLPDRPPEPPKPAADKLVPVPMPDPPPETHDRRTPVFDADPDLPPIEFDASDLTLDDPPPVAPAPAIVDVGHRGLIPPEGIEIPVPPYPETARRARLEADVTLEAVIDEEGRVVDARVVRVAGPDAGFSESALATVTNAWRYRPGTLNGRAVSVRLTITVRFTLH